MAHSVWLYHIVYSGSYLDKLNYLKEVVGLLFKLETWDMALYNDLGVLLAHRQAQDDGGE